MTRAQWQKIKNLGGEGILNRADLIELQSQRARVLWLMLDGNWHSANRILAVANGREGLRRLRELREIPYVTIERRRNKLVRRDFMYRLVYAPGIQVELF